MTDNQPFACTNKALAFSLLLAGCTLAPVEQGGPAINRYTRGFIRNRRDVDPSWSLDTGARFLFEHRVEGHVSWLFVRDETFNRAINAWENRVNGFRQQKDSGVPMALPEIQPEVVMEVLCVRQNSVEAFNALAFLNPNCQLVCTSSTSQSAEPMKDERGDTMAGIEKTHIKGRVREWGLNNSDAWKRKEGVLSLM